MKIVGLVFGGQSAEREVSIKSAMAVRKAIDKKKYKVVDIEITKDPNSIARLFKLAKNIDVALLVLHGPGGEDGKIQAVLDLLNIPYTSSGVLASAIAMNKNVTKELVKNIGIKVAKSYLLTKQSKIPKLSGTYAVKPNSIGSSIGTSIVPAHELKSAIKQAFKFDTEVLVEQYIKGREYTVPVLDNKELPVIEIMPKMGEFFDYNSKYLAGGSDEIVPARLDPKRTREVQKLAVAVHKYLGCKGITRSDFILSNGQFYFLEINTIPGMTDASLVPKSAKAAGMPFSKLIDRLISLA